KTWPGSCGMPSTGCRRGPWPVPSRWSDSSRRCSTACSSACWTGTRLLTRCLPTVHWPPPTCRARPSRPTIPVSTGSGCCWCARRSAGTCCSRSGPFWSRPPWLLLLRRSQPGGTAYPAGVAVHGADQSGVQAVGEPVIQQQGRHRLVARLDVRGPAAEHDPLRIDHVDDAGQAARQLIAVLPEGFACLFLSSRRGPGQLNRAAPAALAGRPAGAAEEGLDAVL